MRYIIKIALTAVFLAGSGCVRIPDADIAFLNQIIPVGSKENEARVRIERRGFTQIKAIPLPDKIFNIKTLRTEIATRSFEDVVQANLGFVKLMGQPKGELVCFARGYAWLVASGDRLICWTVDSSDEITWRQASWFGASL